MSKIILGGNPVDGFTAYGPFDPADDERVYDQFESDGDWWTLTLKPIPGMDELPPEPPALGFGGARARICYEWINSDGEWAEGAENIGMTTTEPYVASIRKSWALWLEKMSRADRRNIRLEVRPIEAEWVSISPGSVVQLEKVLTDVENSTFHWGQS